MTTRRHAHRRSSGAVPVRVGLAGIAALLTLVAGCANALPHTLPIILPAAPGLDIVTLGVPCDNGPLPQFIALPADAVLVGATRCIERTERVPGDGEWSVMDHQEITAGLDELTAALRLPSPAGTQELCAESAPVVITVTDSTGHSFAPAVPHECMNPLPEVVSTITSLAWTSTATTPIARVRTELEVTTGCDESWKPVIGFLATGGQAEPPSTVDVTPRPMMVCRYEISPEWTVPLGDQVLHAGRLTGGSTLDSAAAGELLAAVAAAPPADQSCRPAEVPFAMVTPAKDHGPRIAIELTGCYRAAVGFEPLRQLDAALVTRLLG
jgi:hypothetical protein